MNEFRFICARLILDERVLKILSVTERHTTVSTAYTNPSRKHSFIFTVWPSVHTNPTRKRSFSKTLFKPEELEDARRLCVLVWTGNIFENETFRER